MTVRSEVAKVYDTVMSIPGMNENVKVTLQTSRKNLLLLNKVIEKGLNGKDSGDRSISILENLPEDVLKELGQIAGQILNKAGLTEMNEKLKAF